MAKESYRLHHYYQVNTHKCLSISLSFFFFALPLLGFQVPQNQKADVLLNALTDEQKVSTYSLAKSIESHSYTSKIKLIFNELRIRIYIIYSFINS